MACSSFEDWHLLLVGRQRIEEARGGRGEKTV
jgi:hypothetical protein